MQVAGLWRMCAIRPGGRAICNTPGLPRLSEDTARLLLQKNKKNAPGNPGAFQNQGWRLKTAMTINPLPDRAKGQYDERA